MEWAGLILLGFLLGLMHAADADHVVAMSTIAFEKKKLKSAAAVGLSWGLGHTLTVAAIGLVLIWTRTTIAPHVGLAMEFSVGVMIVLLGIAGLRSWFRLKRVDVEAPSRASGAHRARPFAVGLVHGVAGSAGVALLVLNAVSHPMLASLYLFLFCLGTIAGMMLVTLGIGIPFLFVKEAKPVRLTVGLAASLLSIGFGSFMMYEFGAGLWTIG